MRYHYPRNRPMPPYAYIGLRTTVGTGNASHKHNANYRRHCCKGMATPTVTVPLKKKTEPQHWIIEGNDSTTRLSGQWYTPGHDDDHSSFQSKLAGIVGVLYSLTFWPPRLLRPPLRLACDGLSVISRLSAQRPINPTEPHADLLTAV